MSEGKGGKPQLNNRTSGKQEDRDARQADDVRMQSVSGQSLDGSPGDSESTLGTAFSGMRALEFEGREHLYELPFDQFQRYKSVQDIVALIKEDRPLRILDVGGHPGLISEFLPEEKTYVLDIMPCDLPNYIQGDGTALPFRDRSFDVVTSLDVYEHISAGKRSVFIDELCRVSSDLLVLSAPFKDREVELAEQLLYDYVVRVFGEFPTLKEHLKHGLPDLNTLTSQLRSKKLPVACFPSGQLYNWLTMMLIKHYVMAVLNSEKIQREVDKLYNLNFSPGDYHSPSYRQVVVASWTRGEIFLQKVLERFKPSAASSDETALKIQLFQVLIDLLNLQVNQQVTAQEAHISNLEARIDNIEMELRSKDRDIANLTRELQEKERQLQEMLEKSRLDMQHIENLERFVEKVKRTIPYRLYSFWRYNRR